MEKQRSDHLELEDGSTIAVIGAGPAGSFFTYFALDFAHRLGMNINVDMIEPKDFTRTGPPGCNNCGGIVSESLIQALSVEGLVIPGNVIRRGIESYTMHLEQGTTVINTPFEEQRIVSMFRGAGPKGSEEYHQFSFDNYLLELCTQKGAQLINDRVSGFRREPDGIVVSTNSHPEKKYDLVVGGTGLNQKSFESFKTICPSFIPPTTTKTFICEYHMEQDVIDKYFGNSMHVFLLNVPHIKFGALIPKGMFVTLVLLGSEINKDIVCNFINSEQVRNCFPKGADLEKMAPCQCFPFINVKGAKTAYDDRVVLIGDSASSKLYKNGIGAAYLTAKAAAKTVIFNGISKGMFRKYYKPTCRELDFDNLIGKLIFLVTTVIQKSNILKKGVFNTVNKEQLKKPQYRRMSSVLWDTFTGSAPYKSILLRAIHPKFSAALIVNSLKRKSKSKTK